MFNLLPQPRILLTALFFVRLPAPGSRRLRPLPRRSAVSFPAATSSPIAAGAVPAATPLHTRMIARHDHLGVAVLAATADAAAALAQDATLSQPSCRTAW